MKLSICPTAAGAAAAAAAIVADHVTAKPDSVLGLPTGRTSLGIYDELVRLHAAGRADFSRAHTFNLDEFIGLTSKDRRSYCAFMEKHLFRRVNIPPAHVHFLEWPGGGFRRGMPAIRTPDRRAGRHRSAAAGRGRERPHRLQRARALRARTHRAELKRGTRRANVALFGGRLRAVPREALSMGMATILEASSIVLVAMGRTKARAVQSLFTGYISTASPVSFLQLHPEVHVIVDRAAAASLPRSLRGLSPGPPATVEGL